MEIGELKINISTKEVERQGQEIKLSSKDFEILCLIAEAYPNAVSKRHIVEKVWGSDAPETDAVRSHMYTLRNAIDKPFDTPIIKTVHGIGFRLIAK